MKHRITDFSNIYSPKNKSIMSKLSKTLNLTSRESKSSTPRSRPSFLSPRNQPLITAIPEIKEVRTTNKLNISKEKLERIE